MIMEGDSFIPLLRDVISDGGPLQEQFTRFIDSMVGERVAKILDTGRQRELQLVQRVAELTQQLMDAQTTIQRLEGNQKQAYRFAMSCTQLLQPAPSMQGFGGMQGMSSLASSGSMHPPASPPPQQPPPPMIAAAQNQQPLVEVEPGIFYQPSSQQFVAMSGGSRLGEGASLQVARAILTAGLTSASAASAGTASTGGGASNLTASAGLSASAVAAAAAAARGAAAQAAAAVSLGAVAVAAAAARGLSSDKADDMDADAGARKRKLARMQEGAGLGMLVSPGFRRPMRPLGPVRSHSINTVDTGGGSGATAFRNATGSDDDVAGAAQGATAAAAMERGTHSAVLLQRLAALPAAQRKQIREYWSQHHSAAVLCGRGETAKHGTLAFVGGRAVIHMAERTVLPATFEKLAGREGSRNWRMSVRVTAWRYPDQKTYLHAGVLLMLVDDLIAKDIETPSAGVAATASAANQPGGNGSDDAMGDGGDADDVSDDGGAAAAGGSCEPCSHGGSSQGASPGQQACEPGEAAGVEQQGSPAGARSRQLPQLQRALQQLQQLQQLAPRGIGGGGGGSASEQQQLARGGGDAANRTADTACFSAFDARAIAAAAATTPPA